MFSKAYETLVLISPDATPEDLNTVETQFEQLITKANGKINVVDRWGKRPLAYPIKKQSYGFYTLIRYSLPSDKVSEMSKELRTFFQVKFNELVFRHVSIKLEKGFTSYKKPELNSDNEVSFAQEDDNNSDN